MGVSFFAPILPQTQPKGWWSAAFLRLLYPANHYQRGAIH